MFLLTIKIIWNIIVCLLAIILLLFIVPISFRVRFRNGNLKVTAYPLLIPIKILPLRQKKKSEKKKGTKKVKKEKEKEKESSKINFDKQMILGMLSPVMSFLKSIVKAIRVRGVKIIFVVNKGDPNDTAILAGRVFAGMVLAQKLISSFLVVKYKKVRVIPDFMSRYETATEFDCKVVVFPCILIVASLRLLFSFIKQMRVAKK